MKVLEGYKSFNYDFTNNYGFKFEEGKQYHMDGDIVYGPIGNGFHFSTFMEDTIRYSKDTDLAHNIQIAKISASNIIIAGSTQSDEYFDYNNNYVTLDIQILKFLTREEIIDIALNLPIYRMKRFIQEFYLSEHELKNFYGINKKIDNAINYYQKDIKDTYSRIRKK